MAMRPEDIDALALAEAEGKAGAALALQTSLAMLLLEKKALPPDDMAVVLSRAQKLLEPFELSEAAMEFANRALQNFARTLRRETVLN
jgi:hypothetical protein